MIADAGFMIDAPSIVVIGAGPAGAVAAAELANLGHDVLLADRATFPRSKVCGCCLGPAGVAILRRLGLDDLVDAASPLSRVTLGSSSGEVTLPFTGSRVIGRDRLDPTLVDAAVSRGARVRFETRVRVDLDHTIRVDDGQPLRPRAIVVADGLAGGSLTDLPEFGWTIAEASRFGAGAVVDATGDAPPHGDLRMLLDSIGYLGIVRLPDDRVDLAAAFHASAVRRVGGPAEAAARLLERHAMPALAAEARSARWQGTPTLTRRRRRVAAGPIACIGDAAGYVEPFTGEGMTWAMRSGVEVATFIDAALAAGQSLDGWNTRHRRLFARHHRRCRLVARTVRHPGLIHHGAALLSRIAPIRTALPRFLTGATGATGAIRGTPVGPGGDA